MQLYCLVCWFPAGVQQFSGNGTYTGRQLSAWLFRGDSECDTDEGPAGGVRVTVNDFRIGIHEVSVGEYRACVDAGICTVPFDYRRTHYCNYGAPGRDNYPQNCVNWEQALQYCQWQGAALLMMLNGNGQPEQVPLLSFHGVMHQWTAPVRLLILCAR
ncbi:SUMF1/EgtB/PvdO family nonheme iron enzyme [Aliamphritea spongicola]|nr:SUMF1/EgtB/PvdO family nonheme iron enzyme [Aliamphritea spongicola]